MKVKTRYTLYFIIVISLSIIAPSLFTNSKYYSSVDVETDISVAKSIFSLKQLEGEPSTYTLAKGETVTAQYQLSNNENNIINSMDMRYYISLVDGNGNPVGLSMTVDDYSNVENKGFGAIELAYDGQTAQNKTLRINISCPADYSGETNLTYKLKVLAEEIYNNNVVVEKTANISLNIVDSGASNNSAPENQAPANDQQVAPVETPVNENQGQENQTSEQQEVVQNNENQNETPNSSNENTSGEENQEQTPAEPSVENETGASNDVSNSEATQEQNLEENLETGNII